MEVTSAKKSGWQQRLAAELKRDKKKSLVMGVLAALAAFACARMVFKGSTPVNTQADTIEATGSVAPDEAGPWSVHEAQAVAVATEPDKPGPVKQAAPRTFTRDLFQANLAAFPLAHKKVAPSKTVVRVKDTPEARKAAKRRAIWAKAQSLRLRSTVASTTPTAIINDRVLQVGEWINGFKVIEITSGACTMSRDNVEVVLEMID